MSKTKLHQTILDKHRTIYQDNVEVVHIWENYRGRPCGNAKIVVTKPSDLEIWPEGISFVAVVLFSDDTWVFDI